MYRTGQKVYRLYTKTKRCTENGKGVQVCTPTGETRRGGGPQEVYQVALCKKQDEITKIKQEKVKNDSKSNIKIRELYKFIQTSMKGVISELEKGDTIVFENDILSDEGIERERTVIMAAAENIQFKEAIKNYPDQDYAQNLMNTYNELLKWEEKRKEKEKKEKLKQEKHEKLKKEKELKKKKKEEKKEEKTL